jgi:hypothetical protein
MKTLFDHWKSFERAIVPKGAGAIQREECRRSFYAGAAAMFSLVLDASEPADEDECEFNMTRLSEELKAFPKDMRMT